MRSAMQPIPTTFAITALLGFSGALGIVIVMNHAPVGGMAGMQGDMMAHCAMGSMMDHMDTAQCPAMMQGGMEERQQCTAMSGGIPMTSEECNAMTNP